MTNREFYVAVMNGAVDADVIAFASDAITKLDHTNEVRKTKAAEKAAAKQAEKAPIREAIVAVMSDEPHTASELIAMAGLEETVKPASIPSLMRPLVEDGTVSKVDVKVVGKGTQRGYVLA